MKNKALAIFKKDYKEVRKSKLIWAIFLFPLIFSLVLPAIVLPFPEVLTPQTREGIKIIMEHAPPEILAEIGGMSEIQAVRYILSTIIWAPLFLLIPLMLPVVLASDSFAGEKERKTSESLLAAPVSTQELFLGKILLPLTLAISITWIHFGIYSITTNAINYPLFGRIIFPNVLWILMMSFLVPVMAFFSVGLLVIISMKVKGVREAQQYGGIAVFPALLILFSQLLGLIFITKVALLGWVMLFLALNFLLLKVGAKLVATQSL